MTMPEPVKMRQTAALEEAGLSEFQRELVQLGAVLKGDCRNRDIYHDKLGEDMTVAEAAAYVQEAFKTFLAEADKCQKNGADGSHVVVVKPVQENRAGAAAAKESFTTRLLGCFACGKQSPTS